MTTNGVLMFGFKLLANSTRLDSTPLLTLQSTQSSSSLYSSQRSLAFSAEHSV